MKESEFVNASLAANEIVDCENSVLKAAIGLVKAAGYNVTKATDKVETHHIETAKEVVKEVGTGVGHFMRGLGRVTLERASSVKEAVVSQATAVCEKGK